MRFQHQHQLDTRRSDQYVAAAVENVILIYILHKRLSLGFLIDSLMPARLNYSLSGRSLIVYLGNCRLSTVLNESFY